MSLLNKQVVSEKAVLLWFVFSAISSIASVIVGSVFIYLVYGCWPFRSIQPGKEDCLASNMSLYIYLLPFVVGVIVGTILTIKQVRTAEH